jgi:hypothetical protein
MPDRPRGARRRAESAGSDSDPSADNLPPSILHKSRAWKKMAAKIAERGGDSLWQTMNRRKKRLAKKKKGAKGKRGRNNQDKVPVMALRAMEAAKGGPPGKLVSQSSKKDLGITSTEGRGAGDKGAEQGAKKSPRPARNPRAGDARVGGSKESPDSATPELASQKHHTGPGFMEQTFSRVSALNAVLGGSDIMQGIVSTHTTTVINKPRQLDCLVQLDPHEKGARPRQYVDISVAMSTVEESYHRCEYVTYLLDASPSDSSDQSRSTLCMAAFNRSPQRAGGDVRSPPVGEGAGGAAEGSQGSASVSPTSPHPHPPLYRSPSGRRVPAPLKRVETLPVRMMTNFLDLDPGALLGGGAGASGGYSPTVASPSEAPPADGQQGRGVARFEQSADFPQWPAKAQFSKLNLQPPIRSPVPLAKLQRGYSDNQLLSGLVYAPAKLRGEVSPKDGRSPPSVSPPRGPSPLPGEATVASPPQEGTQSPPTSRSPKGATLSCSSISRPGPDPGGFPALLDPRVLRR